MFKGGMDEAIAMLKILGSAESKKLLETIRQKDPFMASELEKGLVKIEDLIHCSAGQMVGLLRDIDLEIFGLALRSVNPEVVEHIMSIVSTGIKLDIEDGLKGPPKQLSKVEEAQDKVLEVMQKKINSGELVLDPEKDILV
jgi:flagellar motor switch protein FliG